MSAPLPNDDRETVAKRWNEHTSDSIELSAAVYWLAVPEVMRRHQARLTDGRFQNWVDAVVHDFFSNRKPLRRILSLGCGDGSLERDLAGLNLFEHCDAFDLSPVAIEKARQHAASAGYGDRISYEVADINAIALEAGRYDSIWFNGSLHHIAELEHVLEQCRRALTIDGHLVVNEYVGPNRFDFTARQKDAMKAAWRLIPDQFKRSCMAGITGAIHPEPPFPDPVEVANVDPSEAVRSIEIPEQLRTRFRICCEQKAGGTLLHFLLAGIAGNFRSDNVESIRVLNMLFEIEDTMIETGELDSDFMLFVAQPRHDVDR